MKGTTGGPVVKTFASGAEVSLGRGFVPAPPVGAEVRVTPESPLKNTITLLQLLGTDQNVEN